MDEISIIYRKAGIKARLRIDPKKHDGMRVAAAVQKLMFPNVDFSQPDPVFDRIMKGREAARQPARTGRK